MCDGHPLWRTDEVRQGTALAYPTMAPLYLGNRGSNLLLPFPLVKLNI